MCAYECMYGRIDMRVCIVGHVKLCVRACMHIAKHVQSVKLCRCVWKCMRVCVYCRTHVQICEAVCV